MYPLTHTRHRFVQAYEVLMDEELRAAYDKGLDLTEFMERKKRHQQNHSQDPGTGSDVSLWELRVFPAFLFLSCRSCCMPIAVLFQVSRSLSLTHTHTHTLSLSLTHTQAPRLHRVNLWRQGFDPGELTIARGDVVAWTWSCEEPQALYEVHATLACGRCSPCCACGMLAVLDECVSGHFPAPIWHGVCCSTFLLTPPLALSLSLSLSLSLAPPLITG